MLIQIIVILKLFCFVNANYELSEGEQCTSDGVNGSCRHIRFCPSVSLVDLKASKHPQVCSYRGKEPIVCCTDCDQNDSRNAVLTPQGVLYKTGTNKSYDKASGFSSVGLK